MKLHTHKTRGHILVLLLGILLTAGCGQNQVPTPDTTATAFALGLQQTMVALDITVQALSVEQTKAANPTLTLTPSPIPAPTNTPGPVIIHDDFSTDVGRWQGCEQCVIRDGSLIMGPYPVSNSAEGYFTICADCGYVTDYKMGVDVVYVNGYSDRGFGLVLREHQGNYIELEISTWQFYGVWYYDKEKKGSWDAWGALLTDGWVPSGYLRPAQLSNRLDVETTTENGKSSVAIRVNSQLINTVEIPNVPGQVGLVVGLHSLGIAFDNFYFEGYPLYSAPSDNESAQPSL
jgi:hypothetical protein